MHGIIGAVITYAGLALTFSKGVSLDGWNAAIGSLLPPQVRKELESVYSTLATGKENLPKLTLPADRDYSGPKIRDEIAAEGFRATLKDHNCMKTRPPKLTIGSPNSLRHSASLLTALERQLSPRSGRWDRRMSPKRLKHPQSETRQQLLSEAQARFPDHRRPLS
jgi:hypothetical protein